jgi:hypothetical protein
MFIPNFGHWLSCHKSHSWILMPLPGELWGDFFWNVLLHSMVECYKLFTGIWNIGNSLPGSMTSHPRKWLFSLSPYENFEFWTFTLWSSGLWHCVIWYVVTNILEKCACSLQFYPEDRDSKFLWNNMIAYHIAQCHNVIWQNLNIYNCENLKSQLIVIH